MFSDGMVMVDGVTEVWEEHVVRRWKLITFIVGVAKWSETTIVFDDCPLWLWDDQVFPPSHWSHNLTLIHDIGDRIGGSEWCPHDGCPMPQDRCSWVTVWAWLSWVSRRPCECSSDDCQLVHELLWLLVWVFILDDKNVILWMKLLKLSQWGVETLLWCHLLLICHHQLGWVWGCKWGCDNWKLADKVNAERWLL